MAGQGYDQAAGTPRQTSHPLCSSCNSKDWHACRQTRNQTWTSLCSGMCAGQGSLYLVHRSVPDTRYGAWHIAGDPHIFTARQKLSTLFVFELHERDPSQDHSMSMGTESMTLAALSGCTHSWASSDSERRRGPLGSEGGRVGRQSPELHPAGTAEAGLGGIRRSSAERTGFEPCQSRCFILGFKIQDRWL